MWRAALAIMQLCLHAKAIKIMKLYSVKFGSCLLGLTHYPQVYDVGNACSNFFQKHGVTI